MNTSRLIPIASVAACALVHGCGDGPAEETLDSHGVATDPLDDGPFDPDSTGSGSGGAADLDPCERSWTEAWEVQAVPRRPDHREPPTIHALATHAAGLGLVRREPGPDGDDEIWFTAHAGGVWQESELVDSTRRGLRWTFLGFDGLAPRIGAQQEPMLSSGCDLALWSRSGDGWQREEVEDPWCNSSMAISSEGAELLRIDLEEIEHLVKRDGSWTSEIVAAGPSGGSLRALEARLVIDEVAGVETRRVAYRHDVGDHGEIHLSTRTGGVWQDELVSASADDATTVQVVPGTGDGIHLGFVDLEGRATLASSVAGGAWASSQVGAGDLDQFEMLLDDAGMGVLIWSDATEEDSASWYATSLLGEVRPFRGPSESPFQLAVTTDHIHVVYVAAGEPHLCHAALLR